MPLGRTHDRITLWTLPIVAGLSLWYTRSAKLTLLVAAGFLFGGLMFGPDLDIYSIQYKRWGILRWIWLPYQRSLRHRSILSHGPLIGTTVRILYFATIVCVFVFLALLVAEKFANWELKWREVGNMALLIMDSYRWEILAGFWGLEFGAMSHYVSDWTSSVIKRLQKKGIKGLLPDQKKQKRVTGRRTSRKTLRTSTKYSHLKPPNRK